MGKYVCRDGLTQRLVPNAEWVGFRPYTIAKVVLTAWMTLQYRRSFRPIGLFKGLGQLDDVSLAGFDEDSCSLTCGRAVVARINFPPYGESSLKSLGGGGLVHPN
jgi:hypothetical protein